MTNTPDNIRNMWEQAANGANPYPSQKEPGMGSGLDQRGLTAGAREQLRRPKPLTPAAQTSDAGDAGDAGAIGPQGPQGPQGAAGAGGAVGAAGYSPIRGLPSRGDDPVSQMKRNASTQKRPLTADEQAAIARHAENAAKKNAGK